jgi:hypothetical protein
MLHSDDVIGGQDDVDGATAMGVTFHALVTGEIKTTFQRVFSGLYAVLPGATLISHSLFLPWVAEAFVRPPTYFIFLCVSFTTSALRVNVYLAARAAFTALKAFDI